MDPVVVVLLGLIAVAVAALAIAANRQDRTAGRRGSDPGKGYHELRSDYQSGVGGGHVTTWKVPRDPQEYARQVIPRTTRK